MVHTFQKVIPLLSMETSYATIHSQKNVLLDFTIGFEDDGSSWFELYDVETGGNDWYATGCLVFEGKELVDFDGVFELPKEIEEKLIELGYTVN